MNSDRVLLDPLVEAKMLQARSVGPIKRQILSDNPDFIRLKALVPELKKMGYTPLFQIESQKADQLQRELDVAKLLKNYYVEIQNYQIAAEYRDFERNIEREFTRRLNS